MGHIRLGTLPKTHKWEHVVGVIAGGADVERIAAASADAAEYRLERASQDQGLAHAFWLLTQIPQAARQSDFADQLKRLGLEVSSKPTPLEIVGAFTNAVDRHVRTRGNRSDLGEMAQHAAAETLTTLAGRELPSLFGPTAGDVQQAFAKLGTSDRFSIVARDFFSRLTNRSICYFLSRELSKHVGPNKRFAAVSEHSAARLGQRPDILARRREIVEHPFGSIKQWMNQGAFLMRGVDNVRAEFSLTALVYNLRRALNILG